jgi:hypothetical protein
MAVPKRFKFKSTKKRFLNINNNSLYILPHKNNYFFNSLKKYLSVK